MKRKWLSLLLNAFLIVISLSAVQSASAMRCLSGGKATSNFNIDTAKKTPPIPQMSARLRSPVLIVQPMHYCGSRKLIHRRSPVMMMQRPTPMNMLIYMSMMLRKN